MASPLKDSKTAPSRLSTIDSDDPPAAVATRPGLGERRTSVVITRRGTLRDLAVGREPSSDGSEVSETATPAARPTWLRPSASTKDLTILRFKKGEREGPPLEVAAVVDICMNPKKREAAGLKRLGKGAYSRLSRNHARSLKEDGASKWSSSRARRRRYAHVVCFASAARVRLDDGTDVVASRLAIKVGAWMTEASFDRECDCQAAAAARGGVEKGAAAGRRRAARVVHRAFMPRVSRASRRRLGDAAALARVVRRDRPAQAWGVAPKVRHAVWGGAGKLSAFAMDRCHSPRGYFSDESRRRRGRDVDIPWTSCGGAAGATWIFLR